MVKSWMEFHDRPAGPRIELSLAERFND